MPLIQYKRFNFRDPTLATIDEANLILHEYSRQGFDLTLRQLYYQFVARALIANRQSEYNKLGSIINDARLAGLIDWDHITDRTRYMRTSSTWRNPASLIYGAAHGYAIDLLEGQDVHVEAWVEKDALVDVVARACQPVQIPFLSCRGYVSQSEMWQAGQRLSDVLARGKRIVILHLGDHDPSGIDMSRDIEKRLGDFVWAHSPAEMGSAEFDQQFEVRRIALTMDQIHEYDPPPNPAKVTDSRSAVYIERHGHESWELDALEPQVIVDLIEDHLGRLLDSDLIEERRDRQELERQVLLKASDRWADVVEFLNGDEPDA